MNESKLDEQSLASKAEVALRKAAKKAILEAQRTGTPVVVWENGRVVEIPSNRFKAEPHEADKAEKAKGE